MQQLSTIVLSLYKISLSESIFQGGSEGVSIHPAAGR